MFDLSPSSFFDLMTFSHQELFEDINYVWEALTRIKPYLAKQQLGKIEGEVSPFAQLIHKELISIGKGSVVEAGAYIKGPCIIGNGCEVRHAAYIRGDVIVGNGCVIGHATEVKGSIFLDHAKAGHFAYIGDSILGHEVNLGAGTKLANLKFNREEISIRWKDEWIRTGLKKMGAILADRVQTGCNAVTNPGTLMGKGSSCYPCAHVGGIVIEGECVR